MKKGLKKTLTAMLAMACAAGTMTAGVSASEDLPTVTWYIGKDPQTDEALVEEKLNELLLDRGVQAKLDLVFLSDYDTKLGMMVTAGEEFDICFTASWSGINYVNYSNQGAFTELTDLVQEYGQDILAQVPENVMDGAKINGELYAIPCFQNGVVQYCAAIPNELIEKYDFDLSGIKELKDLEPLLAVIKENEPELYPIQWNHVYATRAHGYNNGMELVNNNIYVTDDYQVTYAEDMKKEVLKTAVDWYQKGYIRADINSVTDDNSEMAAGKYGISLTADMKPGVEANYKSMYGRDFTFVQIMDARMLYDSSMSSMNAISATSKQPELAMQVLNLANTDAEFYNTICYGVEGVHYTKNDDGSITRTDAIENYNPNKDWAFGCQFNAYPTQDMELDNYDKMLEYNTTAAAAPLAGFVFVGDNTVTERTNLSTVTKEYGALFNGSVNLDEFDAKWDEMMGKLEAAGLQTVIDDMQQQVDAWVAAK